MNVLLLSTHLNSGGITSYLFTLSKGLIKQGHHVHIASSGGNMTAEFEKAGVKVHYINIKTKSELSWKIYAALMPLKKIIKDNDIEIIHSQTRITQVMGQLLNIMTGKVYVSTCHGYFKNRLSRRIFPCWGEAVVAISTQVKDHLLIDFKLKADKVHLVQNGVDLEKFYFLEESFKMTKRKQFQIFEEKIIGMIARFSDVKGQDLLISAMPKVLQQFPKAKLFLVGEGRFEDDLRKLVSELRLEDYVYFYPIVNQTISVLSLFDVFVMPSRQEGLGISIMEAQAAGIPVVGTRVGGIPSLIEHGKTGILVEPEDPDDLARGIFDVLRDPEKGKSLAVEARRFIENGFSAEKMVNGTVKMYRSLMRSS